MVKSPVIFKLGKNIPNIKFIIEPRSYVESSDKPNSTIIIPSNILTNNDLKTKLNRTNESPTKTSNNNQNQNTSNDGS